MNKLIALWMGERDGDKPWNLNVVERFGWVTCPSCKEGYALRKLGERTEQTIDQCQKCNGTGKIRAEWAKYAKEGRYEKS